ncbi:MAG: medium chain dehydrogenase/reductase family protein [Myxococcota bacterium]|jgi:NADPH:quinone reductase-like Zn-dependent oxidoreductase
MRALVNTRFGGPEVLEVQERPDPLPQPGQVLVRVSRAGLNFADIAARVGLYPDAPKFPTVMGYEAAGRVEAVGSGVAGLAKGDRVVALCRFGAQASLVVAPATQVRKIPDAMSFDEAAALPVNYLTAYHMLFWVAPLMPGMKVLIHMAAGGVGLAAIQLCRTVKDVEIFGTASAGKHALLEELGVHHRIDYRAQDYAAEVLRLTDGKGVHRILDALGGPDWARGYSILRKGGHLLCFGWANMVQGEKRSLLRVASQFVQMKRYSPMDLMDKNRGLSGVNLGHLWDEVELLGDHLERLLELYRTGQIRPHVDKIFPLEQAGEAHAYVQARKNVGKVLLSCD